MFRFLFRKKTITHKGKKYTLKDIEELLDKEWGKQQENSYSNEWKESNHFNKDNPLELTEHQRKALEDHRLRAKAVSWKARQRKLRREGKLDQDKINELNKLGMVWDRSEDENDWENHFWTYKNNGLCEPIIDWVKDQREQYHNGSIPEENLIRLKAVKFPFEPLENETYDFLYYQLIEWYMELTGQPSIKNQNKSKVKQKSKPEKKLTNSPKEIIRLKKKIDKVIMSKTPANAYYELFNFNKAKFDPEVRRYSSELSIKLLDQKLLPKGGEWNDIKSFPPVAYLITYYHKEKNGTELKRINRFINKFPILKIIYGERINKLLAKC